MSRIDTEAILQMLRGYTPPQRVDAFTANLCNCPRCGLSHAIITFKRLINPDDYLGYTFWAMCEVTQQPMMVGVGNVDEDANAESYFV